MMKIVTLNGLDGTSGRSRREIGPQGTPIARLLPLRIHNTLMALFETQFPVILAKKDLQASLEAGLDTIFAPPRWGGMVLATIKKTKDKKLHIQAYPP